MNEEMNELSIAERQIPSNLALLKMQNDSIQALAVAHPRDLAKIKVDLENALKDFPELAFSAIYAKPVGQCRDVECRCGHSYDGPVSRGQDFNAPCPRCHEFNPKENGVGKPHQKFARGLSIRAAETLAEIYGYNYVRADVNPAENGVKIEATFTDYQRGRIWQASALVSRFYRGQNGQMQSIDESRFNDTVVKAAQSKLIREVINRSVNAGLKAWFYDKCEAIQGATLKQETVDKIAEKFTAFKLSLEDLGRIVGRPATMGWTETDRKTLLGIYAGLKSGDVSVEDLFVDADPAAPSQPKTGPVSGTDLEAGGRKPENVAPATSSGGQPSKQAQESAQTVSTPAPEPGTANDAVVAKQVPESTPGAAAGQADGQAAQPAGSGEMTQAEQDAAALSDSIQEAFPSEYELIFSSNSAGALTKLAKSIDEGPDYSPAAKQVMHGWINRRREQLKAGKPAKGQQSLIQ